MKLTEDEIKFIEAYRQADVECQKCIKQILLCNEDKEENRKIYERGGLDD